MTAYSCTTAGAMGMGAHTRGRGGQVFPHPPPPKAQSHTSDAPAPPMPSATTGEPSERSNTLSAPCIPSPCIPPLRACLRTVWAPFSSPPSHRSLATYGSKKNHKKHLESIDLGHPPLRNWGWRGVSAPRSLKTEDSAVFLMAGLCPFILRQFCPVAIWSASTVHGIQSVP